MTITDKSGKTRERSMEVRTIKFKDGDKKLVLFQSPADIRNTGLLSIDYKDPNKDDDQWLYMPALHRSSRITSKDKSGSFIGSDLSYADMTRRDADAYNYTMLKQSDKVGDEDCWMIEGVPKTEKEKSETGYAKADYWISKKGLYPIQAKIWLAKGNRIKYIKYGDNKKIDGIWVSLKVTVRTMKEDKVESTTVLATSAVRFSQSSVQDSEFSQSRLEKGL